MQTAVKKVETVRPEDWQDNEVDQLLKRVEEIREGCQHDLVKTDQVVTSSWRYGKWIDRIVDRKKYYSDGNPPFIAKCLKCSITKQVLPGLNCINCFTPLKSEGSVMVGMDRMFVHKCPNGCPGEHLST